MLDAVKKQLHRLTDNEKKALYEKLQGQLKNKTRMDENSGSLSHAQQRLWILHQLNHCQYLYHVPLIMTVPQALDSNLLEHTLSHLVQKHSVLAANFIFEEDAIVQRYADALSLTIHHLTLDTDLAEVVEVAQNPVLSEFFLAPFTLESAPLFRVALLNTPQKTYLLFCFHHLIIDGWSIPLFLAELQHQYSMLQQQKTDLAVIASNQYAEFVAWEKTQHHSNEALDYWMHRLTNKALVVDIVTDFPRSVTRTGQGNTCYAQISGERVSLLNEYAQYLGVSLNQLVLFAFQFMLARYSDQEEITLGIPVAGRTHKRWQQTIGMFVNTCLHTITINYDATIEQQIREGKQHLFEDLAHSNQPFDELVKQLHAHKQIEGTEIFNILYNFIQFENDKQSFSIADGVCKTLYCILPTSKFDLSLNAYAMLNQLDLMLEFSTDLYQEQTVQQMLQYLLAILNQLPASPAVTLKQLSINTVKECMQ